MSKTTLLIQVHAQQNEGGTPAGATARFRENEEKDLVEEGARIEGVRCE